MSWHMLPMETILIVDHSSLHFQQWAILKPIRFAVTSATAMHTDNTATHYWPRLSYRCNPWYCTSIHIPQIMLMWLSSIFCWLFALFFALLYNNINSYSWISMNSGLKLDRAEMTNAIIMSTHCLCHTLCTCSSTMQNNTCGTCNNKSGYCNSIVWRDV